MNEALIAELRQKFPADKPKMLAYLPGDRPIGSPSNLSYLIERVIKALETIPSATEQKPDHTAYLRQILLGLECQNIEDLLSKKQDPLLFRYLGERITCSAKAGAVLGVGIAPEEA